MKKLVFLLVPAALVLAGILYFLFPARKPWKGNVLVITLDTTRADTIGCYGDSEVRTPNIDRLAAQGVRFENCYSPVPLTLPSHCSIFTGLYPIGHGVRINGTYFLRDEEQTMAECFKQEGYHTYAVVACHVLLSRFGLKQGFDLYDDSLNPHELIKADNTEIRAEEVYGKFHDWFEDNWNHTFFAWVHFFDPHTPYAPPRGFFRPEDIQDAPALYRGEISYMDTYIGKIISSLEAKGILDNTLVVLVGDHGEAFGEHGEYASHRVFCYEENLKVPFVMYNPRLFEKPVSIGQRVNTIDIMSTLAELTGFDLPSRNQGRSLLPLIKGRRRSKPPPIYIESMFGQEMMGWAPLTGIIDGDYKFISLPEPELYDLKNDPKEKENLFAVKPELSRKLDGKLADMVAENSGHSSDSTRNLDQDDIRHLKALGYVSAFSQKSQTVIDPKKGIWLQGRILELERQVARNELDAPEEELETLLREQPEMANYMVHGLLARIKARKNDIAGAQKSLDAAIAQWPDQLPLRLMRAQLNAAINQTDKAIAECLEILGRDANLEPAHILLADIYESLGDMPKCLDHLRAASEIQPRNLALRMRLADALIRAGRIDETAGLYDELLTYPEALNHAPTLYRIAIFKTEHGSLPDARRLMRMALERPRAELSAGERDEAERLLEMLSDFLDEPD